MHSLVTRRRDWERIAAAALLLLAVLWRLPFLGAGIDYKDTGYYLAGYKHAFSPGGLDDIGLFMTNLTGGLLYRLLPSHHLLAFRVLDAVAYAGIARMLFRTLRGALPDAALAGVLLAASLVVRRLPMTLSYNTFTALFCAAAFCLLYTGLAKGKPRLAALPGLAVGLGVFYRVPNVLQLGYCAAIAWHFLLCERDLRRMGKHLLRFFL
ncbi:MAG TPA: hypothetical protein VLA21_05325, partial [Candidatus Limnocylindria bacterium]|nr:hypothetical protein [Candidatus Limnocylindria bacterium]